MKLFEYISQCFLIIALGIVGFVVAAAVSALIGLFLAGAFYMVNIIFALGLEKRPEFWSKSWFIGSTISFMVLLSASTVSKMSNVRRY
jgi:hypothetical protein